MQYLIRWMDFEDQMDIPEEYPEERGEGAVTRQSCSKEPSYKDKPRKEKEIDYFKGVYRKQDSTSRSKENIPTLHNSTRGQSNQEREEKTTAIREFLHFQDSFAKQKEDNLTRLKENKEEMEAREYTGTPSINSHSRKLTTHLVEPYYERLSRSKSKTREKEKEKQKAPFAPEITLRSKSMSRSENVADILYGDAKRRIQKGKIHEFQKTQKDISHPVINTNTDRLISRTLKHEFHQLAEDIDHFTPVLVLTTLNSLFNFDLNPKKGDSANPMSTKITKLLFSKEKTVTKEKLWDFVSLVLGLEQGRSSFEEEEVKHIRKHFGNLYRNRMTKERKQNQEKASSFKPGILKKSERLAQAKRDKLIQQAQKLNLIPFSSNHLPSDTIEIPISDLYLMQRLHKQETLKKRHQSKQEEKELRECTFKPALTEWKGYKECTVPATRSSLKRLEHLKTQSRLENTLPTMKTQQSFTSFKQNLPERKSISRENPRQKEVKNMDITVQRMAAARQQRELTYEFHERGYPKHIDNWEQYRKVQKRSCQKSHQKLKGHIQEEPLRSGSKDLFFKNFIFDVHISTGVVETVRMRAGEDPAEVIQRLSRKHYLEESKKHKLLEMIKFHTHQRERESCKQRGDNH